MKRTCPVCKTENEDWIEITAGGSEVLNSILVIEPTEKGFYKETLASILIACPKCKVVMVT